jgi:MoxR-like ATPase
MILAVNTALYLRRPLLLTGKPGTGKSTLISKVAFELKLGPVLNWPISSRSTVRGGVYEYDAVGRLQAGKGVDPPVESYLTLGPLGTALTAKDRPRALLIDEIDKSDLDFANDLLNVIEEGEYPIPELQRLGVPTVIVKDVSGRSVDIQNGRLFCRQFPFVVMTSNGEREFPPPFLRRCVRLKIDPPTPTELAEIVDAHLAHFLDDAKRAEVETLIAKFVSDRQEHDISTDQLLNAIFLTVAMRGVDERTFSRKELDQVQTALFHPLSGAGA